MAINALGLLAHSLHASVPEALNLGDSNIFRIHGSWFGTSPISMEVFSPDGEWVVMHQFQFPNSEAGPYCVTNNWNLQIDVTNIANTSNISMFSSCMARHDRSVHTYELRDHRLYPSSTWA